MVTAAMMGAVILFSMVLLLMASPIQRVIGTAGASIISRVMGLILASVAVDNILHAVNTYFQLGL